jgi:aminopeptidase
MADPRHAKLAQVLINYSLGIQPGDKLLIRGPALAAPLIREVYREALRAGALVETQLSDEGLTELALRESSEEQLRYVPDTARSLIEGMDAILSFWGSENTKSLSGVDPKRLAISHEAMAPLLDRYLERAATGELRWCGTLYPTQAHAQDAGMSLADYEDFVYGAGMLDRPDPAAAWREVQERQQRVADYLGSKDEIRIVAPDTDLTYRVGGRKWLNASGTHNFPDGEVFTGPIEDSVQGHVRFTYPAVYEANEVEDVRLVFRDGRAVEATAARGEEFLHSMLDMDPGARLLGEVAFGLNYDIKSFTRNTLFDEKIGGTMHMALGKSYPETGGVNESALHWDMVCDLREGQVYADGELCYEGGKFNLP